MIEARDFVDACLKREFSLWTGVACSQLSPLVHYVRQGRNLDYVGASGPGEAVAIAAGAYLGGRRSIAVCSSSQLGDMVNPLAGLAFPFRLPLLLLVAQPGPSEGEEEPTQDLMPRIAEDLLQRMRIHWQPFPEEQGAIEGALEEAVENMDANGLPFAFVMNGSAVVDHPLATTGRTTPHPRAEAVGSFEREPEERMSAQDAIGRIRGALTGAEALVATPGRTARELFAMGHRSSQFYLVGSEGCAAAIGLGVQRACEKRDVVVLDGDGPALMQLGSLATIGRHGPKRLTHVLIDGEGRESPGGPPPASWGVDFASVAVACGYRNVWWTDAPDELADLVREARRRPGPSFIHVKVAPTPDSGAARPHLSPVQVKAQFMDWLQQG